MHVSGCTLAPDPLTVLGVCGACLHSQPPGSGDGIPSARSKGSMVTELQLGAGGFPPLRPHSASCRRCVFIRGSLLLGPDLICL